MARSALLENRNSFAKRMEEIETQKLRKTENDTELTEREADRLQKLY